jgi:hypothetical protein
VAVQKFKPYLSVIPIRALSITSALCLLKPYKWQFRAKGLLKRNFLHMYTYFFVSDFEGKFGTMNI